MPIEFWFEFASTYSYPAATRVERLAHAAGARVVWRPLLLGPIFHQQGWTTSPFNIYVAKGKYMWRDMERTCENLGIPFRRPSVFPRNGLLPGRVACAFSEAPWIGDFIRNVYRANFADDLEISDPAVIKQLLLELGQDPELVLAQAQSAENKDRLRAQTEQAQSYGIFGAPTVRIGDELFWGNDRLEDAMRWLARPSSQR